LCPLPRSPPTVVVLGRRRVVRLPPLLPTVTAHPEHDVHLASKDVHQRRLVELVRREERSVVVAVLQRVLRPSFSCRILDRCVGKLPRREGGALPPSDALDSATSIVVVVVVVASDVVAFSPPSARPGTLSSAVDSGGTSTSPPSSSTADIPVLPSPPPSSPTSSSSLSSSSYVASRASSRRCRPPRAAMSFPAPSTTPSILLPIPAAPSPSYRPPFRDELPRPVHHPVNPLADPSRSLSLRSASLSATTSS